MHKYYAYLFKFLSYRLFSFAVYIHIYQNQKKHEARSSFAILERNHCEGGERIQTSKGYVYH